MADNARRSATAFGQRPSTGALSTLRRMERRAGWLFLAPNLLGYLAFWLFPVGLSLVLAFSQWNFISGLDGIEFVALRNFVEMAGDRWFTDALVNTLVLTGIVVPVAIGLGLVTAAIINQGVYLKSLLRGMIFLPYVTNLVAISAVWLVMFHPTRGPINRLLVQFGIAEPPGWVASSDWSLATIIIVTIWLSIGFQMLIYTAGMQSIPNDLYESAEIDGAGWLQQFLKITVPMLRPTTFFLFITGFISSFKVFAQVRIMTNGGPGSSSTVLVHYIYRAGFEFYRMGYASAMAWALFALVFLVTLIQWRMRSRLEEI